MVSFTPRHWRSQPASMTHAAPSKAPARQAITVPARPDSGSHCATAAQPMPPRTSAPSPPMMTRPARIGIATHRAVSISGAARCSVFCQENQLPKAPLNSVFHTSTGLAPAKATKTPNSPSAATMAATGSAASRRTARMGWSSGRVADHAFDQVVHLLQHRVGLPDRLAGRDDDVALVVLQRALEDVE